MRYLAVVHSELLWLYYIHELLANYNSNKRQCARESRENEIPELLYCETVNVVCLSSNYTGCVNTSFPFHGKANRACAYLDFVRFFFIVV